MPLWRLALCFFVSQGFIALDGCSLTVGEVSGDTFCVYLIPETLSVTTFGTRKARRLTLLVPLAADCVFSSKRRDCWRGATFIFALFLPLPAGGRRDQR